MEVGIERVVLDMWLGTQNVSRVGPRKCWCKVLLSGCK